MPTPTATPSPVPLEIEALWIAGDADGSLPGVQVQPIAGAPAPVRIWIVARCVEPVAVGASLMPPSGGEATALIFQPHGDPTEWGAAIEAALEAGQLDATRAAAIADAQAMEEAHWLVADWTFGASSAPGEYRVEVAVQEPATGTLARASAGLSVWEYVSLSFDLGGLDYGTVMAGAITRVSGDAQFAIGDGAPTLRNDGNVPVRIGLRFGPMVSTSSEVAIRLFGGALFGEERPCPAGEDVWFSRSLQPGEVAPLDMWVEPPAEIPAGSYHGGLDVLSERG